MRIFQLNLDIEHNFPKMARGGLLLQVIEALSLERESGLCPTIYRET